MSKQEQAENSDLVPTLLLSWIMEVMLSWSFPGFDSRERMRHSIGRILLYKVASISVSCLPSSVGSMSSSFNFFDDLGRIGGGGGDGRFICVVLIGPSPPYCHHDLVSVTQYDGNSKLTARSMRISSCFAAGADTTSGSEANSFSLSRIQRSSF